MISAGIGLWRHHYLKIMNAEPEKVYNKKPIQPKRSSMDANSPKVSPKKGDENTDAREIELSKNTQHIDNSITPQAMDNNTGNTFEDTVFGDIEGEYLTPEIVETIVEYEEIQAALPALNSELKPLLDAIPLDMDAIRSVNEKKRNLKQRRKELLEILAKFSDEAFNELQATLEREKAAKRMMAELDQPTSAEESTAESENEAKLKRLPDEVDDLQKSIKQGAGP